MYNAQTPVLLISFNRPETTFRVFNRIKEVQPKTLYLAFDGPRNDRVGEYDKCMECRKIAEMVNWNCDLHTLFRENNVGCGFGPSDAISWAFETSDRLIVLEDDCFPSKSFFSFCDDLLERYEEDKRIWIIGGLSIYAKSKFFRDADYLFSHQAHTWGWATWKNRWKEFDMYVKDAPKFLNEGGAFNVFDYKPYVKWFNNKILNIYQNIDKEIKHSWDTQWDYARAKNGGLGIIPRINLIQNTGAENGTHSSIGADASSIPTEEFDKEIIHPTFVLRNKEYDDYHYKHYLRPNKLRLLISAITNKDKFRFYLALLIKKIYK